MSYLKVGFIHDTKSPVHIRIWDGRTAVPRSLSPPRLPPSAVKEAATHFRSNGSDFRFTLVLRVVCAVGLASTSILSPVVGPVLLFPSPCSAPLLFPGLQQLQCPCPGPDQVRDLLDPLRHLLHNHAPLAAAVGVFRALFDFTAVAVRSHPLNSCTQQDRPGGRHSNPPPFFLAGKPKPFGI